MKKLKDIIHSALGYNRTEDTFNLLNMLSSMNTRQRNELIAALIDIDIESSTDLSLVTWKWKGNTSKDKIPTVNDFPEVHNFVNLVSSLNEISFRYKGSTISILNPKKDISVQSIRRNDIHLIIYAHVTTDSFTFPVEIKTTVGTSIVTERFAENFKGQILFHFNNSLSYLPYLSEIVHQMSKAVYSVSDVDINKSLHYMEAFIKFSANVLDKRNADKGIEHIAYSLINHLTAKYELTNEIHPQIVDFILKMEKYFDNCFVLDSDIVLEHDWVVDKKSFVIVKKDNTYVRTNTAAKVYQRYALAKQMTK